jgi:hypothetical protein
MALIGSTTLAFAGALLLSWMRSERFAGIVARISNWLERKNVWGGAVLVSLFLLLGGAYTAMLTPEIGEPVARAYFERLAPLAVWFSGLSLQTWQRFSISPRKLCKKNYALPVKLSSCSCNLHIADRLMGCRTASPSESAVDRLNDLGVPLPNY